MKACGDPIREKTQSKLTQVFRYLQALDQLRNPVQRQIQEQLWKLWVRDLPEHSSIRRGTIAALENTETDRVGDTESNDSTSNQATDGFLLAVKRPELTEAPEPPEEVRLWLEDGWKKVDGEVKVLAKRTVEDEDGNSRTEQFQDDPERIKAFKRWVAVRNRWVETERPARQAMAVFERLYALHSWIERESEQVELLLGDGLLHWPRKEESIHHPVLLQRVQLHFDPSVPEFTIENAEQPPELYTALFRSIAEISGLSLAKCIDDLDQGQYHPFGGEETTKFLERLIAHLTPHGRFLEETSMQAPKGVPTIRREPVFFLRKRNLGFSTALESILKDLPERETFPESLANIVGITTNAQASENQSTRFASDVNGEDDHVLLSKEANGEQLEIVQRLEKYGSVLVILPKSRLSGCNFVSKNTVPYWCRVHRGQARHTRLPIC